MNPHRLPLLTTLALICILFLFSACVGGKQSNSATKAAPENEKIELGAIEDVQAATVLKARYDNIIIRNFTSSSQIQTDYPNSIQECETQIIKQLKNKKTYKNVTSSSKQLSGKSAVVDLKIVDMRITSGAARLWGGAFAGSSFMDILVEVRNAGNEKIIYQQVLTTSNNAWAASYNGGSSDTSLPADFGTLIGEYLSKLIPASK